MSKKIVLLICLIALCFTFDRANAQPDKQVVTLSDLNGLAKIEKRLPLSVSNDKGSFAIQKDFSSLRKALINTPMNRPV